MSRDADERRARESREAALTVYYLPLFDLIGKLA